MKKILVSLTVVIMAFFASNSLYAQENANESNPSYYHKISETAAKALLAAPAATGKTAFELAAKKFNKWMDQQLPNVSKNERPYVDARTMAFICDSLVKSYRSGNTAMATEIASRIPVDMSVEEKIAFLEKITNAYLASEAKKK